MVRQLALATLMILAMYGCSRNEQTYYAIDHRTDWLPDNLGPIISSDGRPARPHQYDPEGPKSRLFTLIVLTSEMNGNNQTFESGGSVATYTFSTSLPPKRIDVRIEWDKQSDVVKYEGRNYPRSKGSLFVILKSPGSQGRIWQLPPPSKTSSEDYLAHLKTHLGGVEEVRSALGGAH